MLAKFFGTVDRISEHNGLNVLIGLFFLVCGVSETYHDMENEFRLGAHHAMVVFGLLHILNSLSLLSKHHKEITKTQ